MLQFHLIGHPLATVITEIDPYAASLVQLTFDFPFVSVPRKHRLFICQIRLNFPVFFLSISLSPDFQTFSRFVDAN